MSDALVSDTLERLRLVLADRYAVERELGRGGMATVFLAQDLRHDRKVAIKVLRPELAAVIGAERFVREIRTVAALQHPHILGLIDSGEVSGTAYYVMPFVEGESLRDRLVREKQLPIADAVRIAKEVASPISAIDALTIVSSDGAGAIPKQVVDNMVQTLSMLKTTTGLDLDAVIKRAVTGAIGGKEESVVPG